MAADGWIVYNSGHPEKRGLWKIRSDGSQASRLTEQVCNWPAVSPNGQYIACTSVREDWIVRLSDGAVVQKIKLQRGTGRARWLPNGSGIAFVETGTDDQTALVAVPLFKSDATRRKLIPQGEHDLESFCFSADGKSVIMTFRDQQSSIVVADGVEGVTRPSRGK